jgi:energy-coupling factor transport system ATP-binding protein
MALTAEEIRYVYRGSDVPVLNGFSATFRQGRITAVTGGNGAGKTTLAKTLVGILKPTAGRILLDGGNTEKMSLCEMGRKVGLVMQDPSRQLFTATVREEMDYGLKNLGLPAEEIESRRKEYLDYFGLTQYEERFPFALSTGEKQRLILAAILAMKPAYLILDEPTSALDKGRRKALGGYLKEITQGAAATGVILISHDDKFISEYADESINLESEGNR